MQLKLKRSQRSGGMLGGKVFFVLDARADLATDERNLVNKYSLGKLVVYDSEARKKHAEAAIEHFDGAAHAPVLGSTAGTIGRSLWSNARGLAKSLSHRCRCASPSTVSPPASTSNARTSTSS